MTAISIVVVSLLVGVSGGVGPGNRPSELVGELLLRVPAHDHGAVRARHDPVRLQLLKFLISAPLRFVSIRLVYRVALL